ncbi:MAG: crossover junction endodeoxyribonuclease RuvC [Clostridiales bacterium]|nr:MAG: crossover junction endodeoxyribonuclease RuvC [Clostridiales bacterium]
MVILGIDPGYATVGYGVLEYLQGRFRVMDYGAVTSPAGMDFPSRLEIIFQGIGELCDQFRPDCMAVEELFFNTNITTGIQVGHARGVILLAGKLKGVQCFEYTPLQVKQSVVGYGRAEKHQVMEMTRQLLGLLKIPKPDDAADALALAICHAHSSKSGLLGLKV